MTRKCFYSFHYEPDNWRVSQVRNIGSLEDNKPASDNAWEEVTTGGEQAIKDWIQGQLKGRTCAIILAGSATAGRKWITYEIVEAWNKGMGVVVVYIHNLKNSKGLQSTKGDNPLNYVTFNDGSKLSAIAKAYNPPCWESGDVYNHIKDNLEDWVEEAIEIRSNH
ncbi:hypothetical protein E7W39_13520 [Cronobacter sakazakii]|uniref:TIR domain-containing protein n=1 Tax=Cronobacter sakazakii TaxID=28141 RepID=UPI001F50EACD|nr:TIR domain-containing protein [Cronobacter sakazakii]MCI0279853.1 hypothetical protein [Cronobacter sakazakii]